MQAGDGPVTGRASAVLLVLALALGALLCPAFAEGGAALVDYRSLGPDTALALGRAVQAACRDRDFQVTVAVVDRGGVPQVALRDQLAGNFTWEVARRKAVTAAGFRQATIELAATVSERPGVAGLQHVGDVLMIGGGVPVEVAGSVVGAVGVSGAPTPEDDHACARAGLEAVADELLF